MVRASSVVTASGLARITRGRPAWPSSWIAETSINSGIPTDCQRRLMPSQGVSSSSGSVSAASAVNSQVKVELLLERI